MLTRRHIGLRRGQRGLSIVEFMVGMVVGLVVVGGATKLFVDNLINNRRLLLETRVNQDLRGAADLIARDVRRAGYWQNAASGVSSDPSSPSIINPYAPVSVAANVISFRYAKDANDTFTAGSVEDFGVRRAVNGGGKGLVQLRTSGDWRDITDPATVDIPAGGLGIWETASRVVDLSGGCPCRLELKCFDPQFAVGGTYYATRPRVTIRQYQLTLTGTATAASGVTRTITEMIRPRNDMVEGACPIL